MKKVALIGDYIGTIEEYVPGDGTYAEDGKIYAATIGNVTMDKEKHIATVDGKVPAEIEVGQVVFGEVMAARKNIVSVIVSRIVGVDRELDTKTGIYVSNISDGYVEKVEDMFGIGDIVKAKVVKIASNLIDISTKGDFGVVKAFCKRCRHPMVRSEKAKEKLECVSCGHLESRKIAADYGNVVVV